MVLWRISGAEAAPVSLAGQAGSTADFAGPNASCTSAVARAGVISPTRVTHILLGTNQRV